MNPFCWRCILAALEDESRHLGRAAESHRHATADSARHIHLCAADIEEAFVELFEMDGKHHGTEHGNADLPAVRMAGEHEVCAKFAQRIERVWVAAARAEGWIV